MKTFALLIVAGIVTWTTGNEDIRCAQEGATCLNSSTIAYCEKTGEFTHYITNVEKCGVDFVCDEMSSQCVQVFKCREAGVFADQSNCSMYYTCSLQGDTWVQNHLSCRNGSYFNNTTAKCVRGDCEDSSSEAPTTEPITTTSPPFSCEEEGVFADQSNCSLYYTCSLQDDTWVQNHLSCRKGSYFNNTTAKCVRGDCEDSSSEAPTTEPTTTEQITTTLPPFSCEEEGVFADSSNCSMYYTCSLQGDTWVTNHRSCRNGSYFNNATAKCVRGDCEDASSEAPTTGPTTTEQSTTALPPFSCKQEGLFEDPLDCRRFFKCYWVDTQGYVLQHPYCPHEYHFDPQSSRCMPGDCHTTTTATTVSTQFPCVSEGFFENPLDCHQFYKCYWTDSNGYVLQHLYCPHEYYFEPQVSRCVPGNCENAPHPRFVPPPHTCTSEGFFADPDSCHRFYDCYLSGGAWVRQRLRCRSGCHFDAASSLCMPGDCPYLYEEGAKVK